MRIIVCVKVIKGELNPFDESALECALRLSRDVTVISMGPESTLSVLKPLTRLGAKVVLLSDHAYAGSDTLATSYVLAEAIKKIGFDLVICGRQSIDGDTAQVGPMLSQKLGIEFETQALSVESFENGIKVKTRDKTKMLRLPCLVTVERSYVLRFPSIFSKLGEVTLWSNSDVVCDIKNCGLTGSPTRVIKTFESEKGKRKCKFIPYGELFSLVEELKSKSLPQKVEKKQSDKKLPKVFAVGEATLGIAAEIADEVILKDGSLPEKVADDAIAEKPDAILWTADVEGRKNAPITAAILNTGLCADCTALECDGEDLFMYRPAIGGSITAKIKCLTKPIMATVRCESESSDIIIAVGKGVGDKMDKIEAFAKELGAEIAGSRGAVDMNIIPYEKQVGLTGKIVSPKIYIAIGISGAVHHTVAIEGAETVIAINPDKNARIFDYADYGIIKEF